MRVVAAVYAVIAMLNVTMSSGVALSRSRLMKALLNSMRMAIVMGMRDLALKVQDLEGAMYMSWEGPASWDYINSGVEYRKYYSEACKQAKGTGTNIGHMKNYVAMGVYQVAIQKVTVAGYNALLEVACSCCRSLLAVC